MQQLVERGAAGRIVIVTSASARGAAVVGASKAIGLEFPEFFICRVFVECDGRAAPEIAQRAASWATAYAAETDVIATVRQERSPSFRVARLRSVPLRDTVPASTSVVPPELCYVVSGGMGGLGSALVDWLIDEQGVKAESVIVLSRRDKSHPRGARVITVDVADQSALLANDQLAGLQNVGGLFHLAAVLEDKLALNVDRGNLDRTIRPKVGGVANLAKLVSAHGWAPDWLVCFSSTSSMGGFAGQSAYCAANAALDQLAQWGKSSLPILTINWGPWAEAGMAAVGTKAYRTAVENGERPLTNAQGLACLASVLHSAGALPGASLQSTASNCDWPRTPWAGMPLLAAVTAEPDAVAAAAAPASSSDEEEDGENDDGSIDSAVVTFLRQHVPRWDLTASLLDVGLDSLDTITIRNKFNKQWKAAAPIELFAPNQTLGELCVRLEQLLGARR